MKTKTSVKSGKTGCLRLTYEAMLDWRNSEESPQKFSVEEFAEQQGYKFCEACEYFVDDALFEYAENGEEMCLTCSRDEWEDD